MSFQKSLNCKYTFLLTSHNTTNNKIIPSSVSLNISATNGHHQANNMITHIYIYIHYRTAALIKLDKILLKCLKYLKTLDVKILLNYIKKTYDIK
jgi:hypothetical protein